MIPVVRPDWPAPGGVRAFATTRAGGVSEGPYARLNLGAATGDEPGRVAENRRRFAALLPSAPGWIRQVHGAGVVRREALDSHTDPPEADALVCHTPGLACTILTADCLPVLLCDAEGIRVAAAHAGWRGLVAGVLQATVAAMDADPARLLAWIGPGIGPLAYTVGEDFQAAVLERYPRAGRALSRHAGRLHADLPAIARIALAEAGVHAVHGGDLCTHADSERFYSYRRDVRTGRMATSIWRAGGDGPPSG